MKAVASKLLGIVAIACTVVACRAAKDPAYVRAFHEAERAETAGRYTEAAARFDSAEAIAPNAREKNHAAYLAAKMLARGGDYAGASARLERLAHQTPETEHTARAFYDLADIRIDHGDPDRGYADLAALLEKHPSSGLATHALTRLAAHRDETGGKKDTIAWLDSLGERLGRTELGETIAYQAALRTQSVGDLPGAHARYLAIVQRWPYPYGNTFDDSLYRASEIDETLGKPEEAIAHLDRMLSERETASLLGTYQRPRYTQAAFRIATLYRDRLNDRKKAREAFHRIYRDFTTSVRRDDALWQEAELYRLDGETDNACTRASTLVREFPDSRYVPCAQAKCASISRPAKSNAPKKCHSYLLPQADRDP
ncbi:tol-pal system YbgF family protein [Pendulispora albinea]|uniref:Tetratricopeptide repeat protein n=1 Tax=Pendulispora albinea TaxID=2741071 RepID=A0ABZ2LJT9_9BACT